MSKYVVMTLIFEKDVKDLNDEEVQEYIGSLKQNTAYWSPSADVIKVVPMDTEDTEELEVEHED